MESVDRRLRRQLESDPYLVPYSDKIRHQLKLVELTEQRLTEKRTSLEDFASGHEYFGLHFKSGEWIFREWAPNATAIYLIGDFSGWQEKEEVCAKKNN